MTQGIFRKLFPGKFHEYLPMKKYFFPKTGHDSEAFPETFSNIWKKFPEILLGHSPNVCLYGFKPEIRWDLKNAYVRKVDVGAVLVILTLNLHIEYISREKSKNVSTKKMKEVYKRDLGFLEAALACGANVPGNYSNGHLSHFFRVVWVHLMTRLKIWMIKRGL